MNNIAALARQYGAYMAFGVALAATLGSLYYSEVAGFIPCNLCWYQRILMYPITLIALVGLFLQDEYLPNYVLPLSVFGFFLAGYHYLVQLGVFAQPTSCAGGIPCGSRYVDYLGFITIPFMALVAFTLISVVMAVAKWAENTQFDEVEEAAANVAAA